MEEKEKVYEVDEETVEEKEDDKTEELQKEADEWKNKYYRTLADTENMKKRLENEAIQSRKYMIQDFALSVLPCLDNLDRALEAESSDEALKKGVQMVRDQLWNALSLQGVSEIECEGKPFDGNYHHAILTEKVEGKEPGEIIEVLQKGYMLKERILRAALVKVSE